jgi:hypothetical protein
MGGVGAGGECGCRREGPLAAETGSGRLLVAASMRPMMVAMLRVCVVGLAGRGVVRYRTRHRTNNSVNWGTDGAAGTRARP